MPTYRGVASGQTFSDSATHNPYQKFKYVVEIDGFKKAGFNKCTGLEAKVNSVNYRDGGDNNTVHKQPGLVEFSDITLERGMSQDKDMSSWFSELFTLDGSKKVDGTGGFRRNLSIVLQDRAGNPVRRWNVYDAFPSNYKFDDLDAQSDDNLIEMLQLTHEGFEEVTV
jgi:phage tail-like protein